MGNKIRARYQVLLTLNEFQWNITGHRWKVFIIDLNSVMRERQNIDEVNSVNNQQQQLLSLSASKSNIQKLDSHIKSTLANLHGKNNKIYVYIKIHNSFKDNKDENSSRFIEMLKEQFADKAEIMHFNETKELLKANYDDNELHYIIVPDKHLAWAETFAKQEREQSNDKKKIYVYGILNKVKFTEKTKAVSKKKIEYAKYYTFDDSYYPEEIIHQIEGHLQMRIRQQGQHIKTWAQTNKFAGKTTKKRTLHFYYESNIEKQLANMYNAYKKKTKFSWIQIYKFESFEDILRKIRQRSIALNKQIETAKQVTSRILKSTSQIEAPSMRSVFNDGATSQLNSSVISSSIRAINKLDQNDVNIIIVNNRHNEMQKLRALVRAQKYNNWFLWEIDQANSSFYQQLGDFLNEQVKSNEQRELDEYQRIIKSKRLIILALSNDYNTIQMFQNQDNVLQNMELMKYNDPQEFSVLLRQGAQSLDDFLIAVVPGGFKSFATEYAKIIYDFESKYRNMETVQNYKFISNANGRHVSNIASSNLLGTQSNLTYYQDNTYLETIMKERDKHFHPLQGLKGQNVYLLIHRDIQYLLDDLRDKISSSPRLHVSSYTDQQFLKRLISTIIIKDSVLIITNDSTLRKVQNVASQFDEVSILNITDRQNPKDEIKVICSGPKNKIYDLISQIPENEDYLQSQIYEQDSKEVSLERFNRILPKKMNFRPGDTISIRLPANLKDEQSHKMQVRLQKHFKKQIKIQYYKDPRDVRLVNKNQQPLSFIIWADQAANKEQIQRRKYQLKFLQELAINQKEQLRQEFIIQSPNPQKYDKYIKNPDLQRFRFVSNRWSAIEKYIIRVYQLFLKPEIEDSIYSDEMIRVFYNDKDKASKDLVTSVSKKRDTNQLNAANYIQFHLIQDLFQTLEQQSPQHKYYIIFNEEYDQNTFTMSQINDIINQYKDRLKNIRIILIKKDNNKKFQSLDANVRKVTPNYTLAAEWLSKIKVLPAEVDYIIPHIIIDKNSQEYYYFLQKYSQLTRRFTFAYCGTKQQAKTQVRSRMNRNPDEIWIIVKDIKSINQYIRHLEKCQNYKNIKFIGQFNDTNTSSIKSILVFKNENKKQIQKFILNIYRRDKRVFFPSSVKVKGNIILAIMNSQRNRPIAINKQQIANWQDILNAKILYLSDFVKLSDTVKANPGSTIYVVYPSNYEKQVTNLCNSYSNLKRVVLNPNYGPRSLKDKFVDNNNKIYIGTYPAEVTQYLRNLRYNIRKSQEFLENKITNELVQINFQKDCKLNQNQLAYLTNKNDSVIVNSNGYDQSQLNNLLNRATKFNYLQIFVGDQQSGKIISEFNQKKGTNIQFIDVKASPLLYMKNQKKNHILQTNQRDELITFLYNIPENRYIKALKNRGKFLFYANPGQLHLSPYLKDMRQVQQRNPKIQTKYYESIAKISQVLKEPGIILINGKSEKQYLQKVKPVSNVNYMVMNDQYNSDKNYASYGNKYFIAKDPKQFRNFINQIASNYQINLQPISLNLDQHSSIINSIAAYASAPLAPKFFDLQRYPSFAPKPYDNSMDIPPMNLNAGVIDTFPPTLLNIQFPQADLPSLPLGFDVLKRIIDACLRSENQILKPGLEKSPFNNWFTIKSEADTSSNLPRSIQIPKPAPPMRLKLAVLHPQTPQFINIGEMLKRNLQPDQYNVTIIIFKSQHELQEYSKNNGQRLNGYDKIVVFLSNLYRKYDSNLQSMKSKLTNRMQYFYFDDNFHVSHHSTLKNHLRPYKIKQYPLPYLSNKLSKHLTNAQKILILAPPSLIKKYQPLKSNHVNIQIYNNPNEIQSFLHKDGTFVILVTPKQNYHALKLNARKSPRCILLVDTQNQLPDDELLFSRIPMYSIYYGPDGGEYLRRVLPSRPGSANVEEMKFLYYGPAEEQLVFYNDYDDYERIPFKDWRNLYHLLLFVFRDKNNWLLKNSPVKPELISLHPKVYLQNKDYMLDFKNSYVQKGYLNGQQIIRKSTLLLHEYSELPQLFYGDEKELARMLQKQETPSVVLFDAANIRVGSLRGKFSRHNWIGITDNTERWINPEGELPQVTDDRLVRKQDMFTNMFNNQVFDQFNDMQYYYLSNKAHMDHTRKIYFRTKEQLLEIFENQLNLLMVIFVQAKDINHIPQALLAQGSQPGGRVKLILLKTQFVDDYDTLYIKFNEIDPVIKHINAVQAAGRIDFIVYNQSEGQRTRQTLIQRRKLRNFDSKPYNNIIEVDEISRSIKGKYKKVYVICLPEEREEIEKVFSSYSIKNKGNPNEGVQYIFIDRLSTIRPNPSYISHIVENSPSKLQPQKNDNTLNVMTRQSKNLRKDQFPAVNFSDTAVYSIKKQNQRNKAAEEYLEKQKQRNDYIQQQEFQMPNTQSNIKPPNKMDNILANGDYILNVDEKLKGLFPVSKFSPQKIRYFSNSKTLPPSKPGQPQLIISTQTNPEIVSLSEQPNNFVVVVGPAGKGLKSNGNTMVIAEQQIPQFIDRLHLYSNIEDDELSGMKNVDDFEKVRVVYDKGMDLDSKRRLLAVSEKNKKIFPTQFKDVGKLKELMQQPDSLLLLMMSFDPQNLQAAVAQQNKVIVKKKKVKVIVPRKTGSDVDGLETILEEQQADQQNQAIKKLTNEQVDLFLRIYENVDGDHRPKVTQPDDWQGQRQPERQYGQAGDLDNITKLNVHSNIRPQNLFKEDEIEKIKQRLTGDLIVLVIDNNKREQVDEAVNKYNVLVQAYTNSMNLENDIRDRKDNVTIAVIDRNMLDKIPPIKKKYPHAAFILQADVPHDEGIEQYRPYLAGQIRKMSDLQKIISDLYLENQRIRYNAQSIRAASRFDVKKTSIVDVSNNERFTVGLSNQKSKKVFLFYKDPENLHVKSKLSDTFNNINFISYKNIADFKRIIATYTTYSSILIANGTDIPELQDFVSKKKQMIYVIRFNPPSDLRDNPKVKKLFSTYKRDDLEKFIFDQFQKYSLSFNIDSLDPKYKSTKNVEGKRYIQKYQPNTFGTTPRFPGDFVPPKSKQSTYSRKYMKSTSRSKLSSRLQAMSPKGGRNFEYFQT